MKHISFRKMNPSQLNAYRQELGLSFNDSQMQEMKSYYHLIAKRDPEKAELLLLDALSALSPSNYEIAPSEFYTNEAEIAGTYSDLMSKRFELFGITKQKMTIAEALGMANLYLQRAGRTAKEDKVSCAVSQKGSVSESSTSIGNAKSQIELYVKNQDNTPRKGDALLLVTPFASAAWNFENKLKRVISNQFKEIIFKANLQIEQGGILPTLLHQTNGVILDKSGFAEAGLPCDLSLLTSHFSDGRLLVLSKHYMKSAKKILQEQGFFACNIGFLTDDANFHWNDENGKKQTLQFPFLYTFLPQKNTAVKVEQRLNDAISKIDRLPVAKKHSPYFSEETFDFYRIGNNGVTVSTAHSILSSNPFLSAIQTVFSAVSPFYFATSEPQNIRLSIALALPTSLESTNQIGIAFAAILGIYRAQTELALAAQDIQLSFNDKLTSPEFTVYATDTGALLPEILVKKESFVYCISPFELQKLPDFNAIRAFSKELSALTEGKQILSVRTFFHSAITDVLQTYRFLPLRIALSDVSVATEDRLDFGILLESDQELPFRKIGTVTENNNENSCLQLPQMQSAFIPHSNYEISILAGQDDTAALGFANDLSNLGYQVSYFEAESSELCRAVLTSNLFIIANQDFSSESKQLIFAMEVMKKAGGEIWYFGKENDFMQKLGGKKVETPISYSVFAKNSLHLGVSK